MKTIISSIQTFISQFIAIALIGSGICLFAGEVRLATLKKTSLGSTKLSDFTKRMTKTNRKALDRLH